MDHLEVLRSSRTKVAAILHRFELLYTHDNKNTYVFVEGEQDRDYYRPVGYVFFERFGHVYFFVCDGKKGVTSVRDVLEYKYGYDNRILFMLDKDHDNYLKLKKIKGKNIFVTKYYSIENYIVTAPVVRILLQDIFRLEPDDPLLARCEISFQRAYRSFVRESAGFMAWIIWARSKGWAPNLNNINLRKLFSINKSFDTRRDRERFGVIVRECGLESKPFSCREIAKIQLRISHDDDRTYLRGKFALWLLLEVLRAFWVVCKGERRIDGKKVRLAVEISVGSVFQTLAKFQCYPDDLLRFLNKMMRARMAQAAS